MITTVLFDMGGTLEDIWVDEASDTACLNKLYDMLVSYGLTPPESGAAFKATIDAGWVAYGKDRDVTNHEAQPIEIWTKYVLAPYNFPFEKIAPHCEEIAHMWEVTHYHRFLRPRVREMLDGLNALGLKLGVISNTAALYQVFDSLEEYGIRDCFRDVTLSSITGFRKPAGDVFTVALRQVQSKPEECVYVGDTMSRDIVGSKRAGFAGAIQIKSHLTAGKDQGLKTEYAPDAVITDIYDVLPTVKAMMEKA